MPRTPTEPAPPAIVRAIYRGPAGALIDGEHTLLRDQITEIPRELFDRLREFAHYHVIDEAAPEGPVPVVGDAPPRDQPPAESAATPSAEPAATA